jgi:tetratricopeptide (TPR) repeat protein
MNYDKTCFVVMPFGKKPVGDATVDFDKIYADILEPAVHDAPLPEGGNLDPYRTDKNFASGDIDVEMFHAIEYSRIAVADITGLNSNVFYELGTRHRARASGTVILRQAGAPLPFGINKIKAFSYDPDPAKAQEARDLIRRVLAESLAENRLDSPVHAALALQRTPGTPIERLLLDAANALRVGDKATAALKLRAAVDANPDDSAPRVRLGIVLRDAGRWKEALEQFAAATSAVPGYAEAWREREIAENKLDAAKGEASLRRAITLQADDFDALASLGGILKRAGKLEDSLVMYRRSADASNNHPYPLLNAITLAVRLAGRLELDAKTNLLLARNARSLAAQVAENPPYNAPWSCSDLAQTCLFRSDRQGFLARIDDGLSCCDASWQPRTFRDTLALLDTGSVVLDGLAEGLAKLDEAIAALDG